jgi:hypothetical protein
MSVEQTLVPELDGGDEDYFYDNPEKNFPSSDNEDEGHEEFKVDDGGVRRPIPIDPNSIKHIFREETWSQSTNEYALGMLHFIGEPPGMKKSYRRMPSFLHLFGLFWTREVLHTICIETNRYAKVVEDGKTKGGKDWYDLDEKELQIFLAVSLYMGMKKQPNVKSYWTKSEALFFCPVISNLLTQRRFLSL